MDPNSEQTPASLIEIPAQIRWPRGSEWRKWDLHFHSPASFDYQDKSVTNEEIVHILQASGIAAVAITDYHLMDVERISHLQKLGGGTLTVFPGIELRTELGGSESVHIIGIFPENSDLSHTWTTIQGKLNLTDAAVKAKGDDKIYVDFKNAAAVIHDLGGIVSVHAGKKSNSIESISNADAFKQAVKEDLARTCIDMLELGSPNDAAAYETKVFPKIGLRFPMVIGSDNHNVRNYVLKTSTWVRCDPTFRGLQQIMNEPLGRVYRGNTPPPILSRVAENKTKYVSRIQIKKVPETDFEEVWFDYDLQLNPGLIAIIGKKGSGKSALSDVVGLVGETRQSEAFSFLNPNKFRQPKNNKARYFEAQVTWENGSYLIKSLDADVIQTAVEAVKYIPQNRAESKFDRELKSVIFSHVPAASRINAQSLDELIEYQTKEAENYIGLLRSELRSINEEIVTCESKLTSSYKLTVAAQLADKQRELDANLANRPTQLNKPELEPVKQAELSLLSAEIDGKRATLSALNNQRQKIADEQKLLVRKIAVTSKLASKLENFRKQSKLFLADISSECVELGVAAEDLVEVHLITDKLSEIQQAAAAQNAAITIELDELSVGSLLSRIIQVQSDIADLSDRLDAPNREYQRYLENLNEWDERSLAILGTADTLGGLKHLEAELSALNTLPESLAKAKNRRTSKSKEIFLGAQSLVDL